MGTGGPSSSIQAHIITKTMASEENWVLDWNRPIFQDESNTLLELIDGALGKLGFPPHVGEEIVQFLIAIARYNFDVDIFEKKELITQYPNFILHNDPHDTHFSIKNGIVKREGRARGDQLCPPLQVDGNEIQFKLAVTCDGSRYNVGLGCYVGPNFGLRSVDNANRFCFHPGMGGGAFRIEGPGGTYNRNIGWTPPAWKDNNQTHFGRYRYNDESSSEEEEDKNVDPYEKNKDHFTLFTITIRRSGNHTVTLSNYKGKMNTVEWTNKDLWESGKSPAFGLYSGDVHSSGYVFAKDFSISFPGKKLCCEAHQSKN